MARERKMTPHTARWERLANEVARIYCPPIYACATCGYPVVDGYCCTKCGSANPRQRQKPARRADAE